MSGMVKTMKPEFKMLWMSHNPEESICEAARVNYGCEGTQQEIINDIIDVGPRSELENACACFQFTDDFEGERIKTYHFFDLYLLFEGCGKEDLEEYELDMFKVLRAKAPLIFGKLDIC